MPETPLLDAREVSKTFSSTQAIKNLSLTLPPGESMAIVGPSGAGKTTLLRLLAGLESPDRGWIALSGQKLEDPSEQLIPGNKAIRMVHQSFDLAANRTVEGNVDMLLRAYTAEYRREETARLLKAVRLNHIATQPVHTLSGGEKQRLALARALADESLLILMDEPLSQQDALLKAHLYHIIRDEVSMAGKGMIVVTHDPREAMAVGHRVGVLIDGKLVQTDSPQILYEQPATEEVAGLMGGISILENERWLSLTKGEALPAGPGKVSGYRPESLTVKPLSHGPFTIERITYQGAFSEIEVISEDVTLLIRTTNKRLSTGQKVNVYRKNKSMISFPDREK
ncbi:ABC transporter ATP-binding protein [Roseivirga sp. BDSF3-8]|uniref:ABC transporter ATP-binding protein n=1 Tax=Roseivirga sp. BDSF3-8 TaxID=3241598 RepID=UPI0035321EC2